MCNTIGVDPLAASNIKGKNGRRGLGEGGSFWTQILGGDMNDFYFEVAVRVVELCRETRSENGGLIGVKECRKRVGKGKAIGSGLEVSEYELHVRNYICYWLTQACVLTVTISYVQSGPLSL
jgi:ESCRT-II complex subunit VPS22